MPTINTDTSKQDSSVRVTPSKQSEAPIKLNNLLEEVNSSALPQINLIDMNKAKLVMKKMNSE